MTETINALNEQMTDLQRRLVATESALNDAREAQRIDECSEEKNALCFKLQHQYELLEKAQEALVEVIECCTLLKSSGVIC